MKRVLFCLMAFVAVLALATNADAGWRHKCGCEPVKACAPAACAPAACAPAAPVPAPAACAPACDKCGEKVCCEKRCRTPVRNVLKAVKAKLECRKCVGTCSCAPAACAPAACAPATPGQILLL